MLSFVTKGFTYDHPVRPADGPLAVYLPRFIPGTGYADLYLNGEPMDVPGLRAANHWNQPVLVEVPERIRLAPSGGLSADIVEAVYLGQIVRYHLSAEGRSFVAAAAFVGKPHAIGDTVSLTWDEADVWPVA